MKLVKHFHAPRDGEEADSAIPPQSRTKLQSRLCSLISDLWSVNKHIGVGSSMCSAKRSFSSTVVSTISNNINISLYFVPHTPQRYSASRQYLSTSAPSRRRLSQEISPLCWYTIRHGMHQVLYLVLKHTRQQDVKANCRKIVRVSQHRIYGA